MHIASLSGMKERLNLELRSLRGYASDAATPEDRRDYFIACAKLEIVIGRIEQLMRRDLARTPPR